jgi:DNA-binding MarR family transcriptional regulator
MKNFEEAFKRLNHKMNSLCVQKDVIHHSCTNLGRMECTVLQFLVDYDDKMTMKELSTLVRVSNSRITRIIDNLVRKGYVERFPSYTDRRVWYAELTPEGREMANISILEIKGIIKSVIDKIPQEKVEEVLENVELFVDLYKKALLLGMDNDS